jgi:ABC-2 type transport system ATP-binding protein
MVHLEKVGFGYKKEVLFDDLTLNLDAGNIYGLLGRNGAGKTSLLRLICGQLYAARGICKVVGRDPARRLPGMLSDIFFLPEEYHVPAVKAREYLSMYAPFYPRFSMSRFETLRDEFDLPAAKKLSELSYGQKKKFLIAFGLATECSLLLFDEPTNGLDIPSKSQFRRLVASAIGDAQTFVISTHQVRDVENLIDPIVIVDDGRVILNASLEEVSRMLSVQLTDTQPTEDEALYSEKVIGGYSVVVKNDGSDTAIDLELLFNAVTAKESKVQKMLSQGDPI